MGPSLIELSAAAKPVIVCCGKPLCCLASACTLSSPSLALQDTGDLSCSCIGRSTRCVGTLPCFFWAGRRLDGSWRAYQCRAPSRPFHSFWFWAVDIVLNKFAAFGCSPPPKKKNPTKVCSFFCLLFGFVLRFCFFLRFVWETERTTLKGAACFSSNY